MFKPTAARTLVRTAVLLALGTAWPTLAAENATDQQTVMHQLQAELAQMREQIKHITQDYTARIRALEARVSAPEHTMAANPEVIANQATSAVPSRTTTTRPNDFNPALALILGGTYSAQKQDPQSYRLQGLMPSMGDVGPGARNFSLGESEISLSAYVDPNFTGKLIFSLDGDNAASVEEAFFQTRSLAQGLSVKGGRFLSATGYLNSQHAHAWDFVDVPLAYQAFFGGQYQSDGVQMKWLAPTERFFELGLEASNGAAFPGNAQNKNGVGAAAWFAHLGDDIGTSASWRLGLSYLHNAARERSYDDLDSTGTTVTNALTGTTHTWIVDGIYKWAPNGNATQTNVKLQGEYFRRRENGTLTYDTTAQSLGTAAGSYASAPSGGYVQAVYQFMPLWRTGLRYDKLYAGNTHIGLLESGTLAATDLPILQRYHPWRQTWMVDYSASEFSRVRLQWARDYSRPGVRNDGIFLQYLMSLGAHGAHAF